MALAPQPYLSSAYKPKTAVFLFVLFRFRFLFLFSSLLSASHLCNFTRLSRSTSRIRISRWRLFFLFYVYIYVLHLCCNQMDKFVDTVDSFSCICARVSSFSFPFCLIDGEQMHRFNSTCLQVVRDLDDIFFLSLTGQKAWILILNSISRKGKQKKRL